MDVHRPFYSPAGSPTFGSFPPDLCDNSIRYWDSVIEDLARALTARGIWKEATVVFTSDCGEELWEHGQRGHGRTLYNEVIHVPLIVKTPDARPRRVTENVSLVDVSNLRPPSDDGETEKARDDPRDALRALGYLSPN